ncbi:hypothetical protein PYW07_006683 [Mythimna separata]|uniref:MULE transposase domain-containing protein n=1 Tax=Mythimna separata TaxID=271217 RepID=A0AAD8DWQ4_MYTSE|nr:hypothetical protein PYW07_006683 [Mythimna separata]
MSNEGGSRGVTKNYEICGTVLLHAGHKYYKHRKNKNSTVWTCANKKKIKCSGIANLHHETDCVVIKNKHVSQCVPKFDENEVKLLLQQTKKAICQDFSDTVQSVYEKNIQKLKDRKGLDNISKIPDFRSVKYQFYRYRNKTLQVPKIKFTNPDSVVIPERFVKYILFDCKENERRIIVFASPKVRINVQNIKHYFCDGTFKSCVKPFTQLYTIHGDIGSDLYQSNIVPLFYALLTDKRGITYEALFQKIKDAVQEFRPIKFTMDFEMAAINAVKNVFPRASIHGCFIHFQRSIYRKATSLELLEYEETKQHIKLCASLAFLPKEDIEDGWLTLMENSFQAEPVTIFNNYFVEQWLEPPEMIPLWCCFKEHHRSSNLVEAWNERFQRYTGCKPSLLLFLQTVATDISTHDIARERLQMNGIPIHKRKKTSIKNDELINKLTHQYENKERSITNFLQEVSSVLKIVF